MTCAACALPEPGAAGEHCDHGATMSDRLDWQRDGHDWPNAAASRFVEAGGLRWHVQCAGTGTPVLLLHGTGASTHSWRDVLPLLAQRYQVIAPDLPGHAFSGALPAAQCTLPGMGRALAALLAALDVRPAFVAGHSAGAALLVHMTLAGLIAPRLIASFNGALLPFHGWAGVLFAPAARLLAVNPLVPRLFAWRAHDERAVRRLIDSTGSRLDAAGVAGYARLVRSAAHVRGAIAMMAGWDLDALARELPRLHTPLLLVTGSADRTVPPAQARDVLARVPAARHVSLDGLGHLAHEEAPQRVVALLDAAFTPA